MISILELLNYEVIVKNNLMIEDEIISKANLILLNPELDEYVYNIKTNICLN